MVAISLVAIKLTAVVPKVFFYSQTFTNLPPSVGAWIVHLNAVHIKINFFVSTNGVKILPVCN